MKHALRRYRVWLVLCAGLAATPAAAAWPFGERAASIWSGLGAAPATRETPLAEPVERHLPLDEPFFHWMQDPDEHAAEAGDRLETREVLAEAVETVKLTDLVPPIRFASGEADIPDAYVQRLREVLDAMRDRHNVRVHFVGHADSQPLSDRLAAVYGDNVGLSQERAGVVAEFFQNALGLPPEAVSFEGRGDSQPVASNATEAGRSQNRRVEVEVWYDEIGVRLAEEQFVVTDDIKRVKVCRIETVCQLRYVEGHARRARIRNLIPPFHYEDDTATPPAAFIEQIEQALHNLRDKPNVVVRFIGFTDDAPLTGRTERIYGTHLGLSRARAHRVALAVQDVLGLPAAAVESDGRGTDQPLAANETASGRALNRRVEVEFWHDDPLKELPDEPQLCPDAAGAELVTRVYDTPWGRIAPLALENGRALIPAGYADVLRRAMADLDGRTNVRLRFLGYTRNERLDRRTATVYGDDIGLAAARARRTMESVSELLGLGAHQAEFEGRGFVHADDVVNAGFVQGDTSHVVVQVVYDELALLDDYDGVDVTRITRELSPRNPFGLNVMRITVDGKPIDDPGKSLADVQRCTDVALDDADIQFRFDSLGAVPRLNVSAWPAVLVPGPDAANGRYDHDPDTVTFRMHTNYRHFIERAEVRIFDRAASLRSEPTSIVELGEQGRAVWRPLPEDFSAPVRELRYVLRVYDAQGRFDETEPQSLWLARETGLVHAPAPNGRGADTGADRNGMRYEANGVPGHDAAPVATAVADDAAMAPPDDDTAADAVMTAPGASDAPALLAGFGEDRAARRNIPVTGGVVRVQGARIPDAHDVWLAGHPVPVDDTGRFVAEEILPSGYHTVEVAVLDRDGNGELFLRDLEMKRSDWFYVGIADVTVSGNRTRGAADLLAGENAPNPLDSSLDGRLAFYLSGKVSDDLRVTASADTREGPVKEIFSNFMNKAPEALFRRIDPDDHYPTFGDDGTVHETAPTLGKFYVRADHRDSHALWGNFNVGYLDNELAHVDRGLYGANVRYASDALTTYGEQRLVIDAFAAEPGTVPAREELRGTGGSLYFLRRQDILTGSERVRIEVRDKDSGLVTGVTTLRPTVDYDIDYLQGRILLAEPLSSTADDHLLVRSGALSGDEAWLVVRYEYTPGFEQIDTMAAGGRAHYWFGDRVRVGLTSNANEEGSTDSNLQAADMILRMSPHSWVKLQGGRSDGLVASTVRSDDGGFAFREADTFTTEDGSAGAYRADVSVGFNDFFDGGRGRLTLYAQNLDAGYSAPGMIAATDTTHVGGALTMPVTDRIHLRAKVDHMGQDAGLETRAQTAELDYRLDARWNVSTGVRHDLRRDRSPVVPATQEEGDRTDVVVQVGYDSQARWRAHGFVQETVAASGNRDDNARIGVGGAWRFTDRMMVDGEVSTGDLGTAGRIGSRYLFSEQTSFYLSYALDDEQSTNGLRTRRGNLITGVRSRLSDSTSVYVEERYQHSRAVTGLTHTAGVTLTPRDRFSVGANADVGTLKDRQTAAETDRMALGLRLGYGFDALQISSAVEYRFDRTEQPDASTSDRTTWLFRNTLRYQTRPDWRLVGKLNHADSESSQGDFFDGGYTEAVLGYAYRPVRHDRLNVLAKYTYFYNVPTTDQITPTSAAARFIQKSHVMALDVDYDLTRNWTVGGKYAYRLGQVSLDRENPVFFDNRAHLYVLRADWRFERRWEALFETRALVMPDFGERRSGALVALYRYVGDHMKVGAGYNFTDFSDDLTNLDFDHRGWFLNLVGTL